MQIFNRCKIRLCIAFYKIKQKAKQHKQGVTKTQAQHKPKDHKAKTHKHKPSHKQEKHIKQAKNERSETKSQHKKGTFEQWSQKSSSISKEN